MNSEKLCLRILINILMGGVKLSESNKCPRLYERNIIVSVEKKIDPVIVFCCCIFVIFLQIIGNDVISDQLT